jgi:hypothetical protein
MMILIYKRRKTKEMSILSCDVISFIHLYPLTVVVVKTTLSYLLHFTSLFSLFYLLTAHDASIIIKIYVKRNWNGTEITFAARKDEMIWWCRLPCLYYNIAIAIVTHNKMRYSLDDDGRRNDELKNNATMRNFLFLFSREKWEFFSFIKTI